MKKNDSSKNKSSNMVLKIGITYIIPIFLAIFGLICVSQEGWRYLFGRLYFFGNKDTNISQMQKTEYKINGHIVTRPDNTNYFAKLTIESVGIEEANIYEGHFDQSLKLGIGHYSGSSMPGQNQTCALTGYNSKEFNRLKNIKKDDSVAIKTSYGTYYYKVNDIQITDKEIYEYVDFFKKGEKLILYTQYPFDTIGKTNQLYVINCEFLKVE